LSVPDFNIVNKAASIGGRNYSGTYYNIKANTTAGILTFSPTDVWELKYPNFDIIGRSADSSGGDMGGQRGGGTGGGY